MFKGILGTYHRAYRFGQWIIESTKCRSHVPLYLSGNYSIKCANNFLLMTPRTILVRGPNWVGDCVLSVPAIKAVRAHFPEAKITLLVRPWVAGLFHSATFIDNLWTQEKAKNIRNWIRTTREIKERHFDLAILLPNSFESAFMVWTAGIPKRVGYQTDGRRLFLTNAVKPSSIKQHTFFHS